MNTINVDKNKFDRDGYVLLKGVFSPDEIAKLRETVYKQYEIDSLLAEAKSQLQMLQLSLAH